MPVDNAAELQAFLNSLPSADACRAELEKRAGGRFKTIFPDEGPYRRSLYPKHMEFFRHGAIHRERLMLAANRVGKTRAGAFETTCHATGRYPHWWEGRRFKQKTDIWVVGETADTTRDILQLELLGPPGQPQMQGTGMLPADSIYHTVGGKVTDSIGTIYVRHVTGDISTIGFKGFSEGRPKFQGTQKNLVWLDEECPADVYEECLLRTMETDPFNLTGFEGGVLMLTFTPLLGLTPLVASFLEDKALEEVQKERMEVLG